MLKKLRKISTVNYVKRQHHAYGCDTCNAHGVKLWREYQVSPLQDKIALHILRRKRSKKKIKQKLLGKALFQKV